MNLLKNVSLYVVSVLCGLSSISSAFSADENNQSIEVFKSALMCRDLSQVDKLLTEGLSPNVDLKLTKGLGYPTAMHYAMEIPDTHSAPLAELLLRHGATIQDEFRSSFLLNLAYTIKRHENENPLDLETTFPIGNFLELIRVCVQYDDCFSVADFDLVHKALGEVEGEEAQDALMAMVKYASSPVSRQQGRLRIRKTAGRKW